MRTALALGAGVLVIVLLGAAAGLFREPILDAIGLSPTTRATPSASVQSSAATSAAPSRTPPPTSAAASSAAPSPTPATTAPPSTPAPSATKPTAAPSTVKVYAVTVARTCGASGSGDCYLTERTQPSSTAPAVKKWPDKSSLTVVCQVQAQSVTSSVLNRSSTVWSRTTTGGYVANIFLDGIDAFGITVPC